MSEYAALVAIDWADQKHAVCLLDPSSGKREHSIVKHTPQALQEWALSLRQRFAGPIAVGLEQSRGPLIYALLQYDFSCSIRSIQPPWPSIARLSLPPTVKTIPVTPIICSTS